MQVKALKRIFALMLALLGGELMKYPLMREYAKTPTMPFANGTFTAGLTNPNHLINPHKVDYFADATGIKTGFSGPAGYCVTASAKRGDMELICVVMGARAQHGALSSFGLASRLMSEAFAQYRRIAVVKKGQPVGQATVTEGVTKTVPAVAGADAWALVKRGEEKSVKSAFSGGNITAPVRAGQQVGAVVVSQNGQAISRIPALAGAAVEKQPWWRKFWPF
jgi:D-alanyl-D-alanine carboxypeptidase (penicillin-binding protein 5/6)